MGNEARALTDAALAEGRTALDERAGKAVLAEFGVAVPRGVVVAGPDGAVDALKGLTPPLAVKVMSADILHKSDAGGVRVNLESAAAAAQAITEMAAIPEIQKAAVQGYLVEEMAPTGTELVIGGFRDPQFGPLVMVGLGGVLVEVLGDVQFRICPITEQDARDMLAELKGGAILDGVRGGAPVSRDAIIDALVKVGGADGLLLSHAELIKELDINPLIVSASGAVAADARMILEAADAIDDAARDDAVLNAFTPLFTPRTVGVVGASSGGGAVANTFLRRLREFGFQGDIYPIHPKAAEIDGIKAYAGFSDVPGEVDYAYVAVAARHVPSILREAKGKLKFAQIISSGFAEVAEGVDLQTDMLAAAVEAGVRVVGPNCLGLYSPRGKVTFPERASAEVGAVGVISQSGGLGTDIVRLGQRKGLRFSALISAGNCADVSAGELLDYYLADPETRVIGLYLEDAGDARRLFMSLRRAGCQKPVVLLKGGRTREGQLAAASHTGALAGDDKGWAALSRQTGAVLVESLGDFLDTLVLFQAVQPNPARPTERVALFGNGGGTSVLATDYFAHQGLRILPFAEKTVAALRALGLPPGTSIANPVDAPVGTLQKDDGRVAEAIIEAVFAHDSPDAFVMHLNLTAFTGRGGPEDVLDNLVQGALRVQARYPGKTHFLLVLRSDGEEDTDALRRDFQARANAIGVPVFDDLGPAAAALRGLRQVELFLSDRKS